MNTRLKAGDKVVLITKHAYSQNRYYTFDEVVRTTKTQAVLSNGVKLKIESDWSQYTGDRFQDIRDWRDNWLLSTPEIEEAVKAESKRQKINKWFDNQRFTDEQKAAIFEMFNEQTQNE